MLSAYATTQAFVKTQDRRVRWCVYVTHVLPFLPTPATYHIRVYNMQDPEVPEASLRVTGSVGGRWEKPTEGTEVDKHKPVVSTWGVFERPKDMSKAFGGGRDPTLKKLAPEESRRRDEETQAILRRLVQYCIWITVY